MIIRSSIIYRYIIILFFISSLSAAISFECTSGGGGRYILNQHEL